MARDVGETTAFDDDAAAAGLIYASPEEPGLHRRRAGRSFTYLGPNGERVGDAKVLARIRGLAIPPAWAEVWICRHARGHIQAIGRDEKGRRQYRYHDNFRAARESAKFEHLMDFAEALPRLRAQVAEDMALPGLGRRKVLATVVHLLETTLIRVGNAAYARDNGSYGLTTLKTRHVKVGAGELRFHFKGKSGKVWNLNLRDRRIAAIVRRCQELPGQDLFQYLDEDGERQAVTSADVNDYLREVSGADITAKDFRTWAGSVLAAVTLAGLEAPDSATHAKKNVTRTVETVSARLGNTPAICRKCYIHPRIVEAYLDGGLALNIPEADESVGAAALGADEAEVLAFLRAAGTGYSSNS